VVEVVVDATLLEVVLPADVVGDEVLAAVVVKVLC
jgi:hypothetical protein